MVSDIHKHAQANAQMIPQPCLPLGPNARKGEITPFGETPHLDLGTQHLPIEVRGRCRGGMGGGNLCFVGVSTLFACSGPP